eukprot:7503863-Pyramimonas_sp.AAC.1
MTISLATLTTNATDSVNCDFSGADRAQACLRERGSSIGWLRNIMGFPLKKDAAKFALDATTLVQCPSSKVALYTDGSVPKD